MKKSTAMCLLVIMLRCSTDAVITTAAEEPSAQREREARRTIAAELSAARNDAEKADEPAEQIRIMKAAGEQACGRLEQNVLLPELFATADKQSLDSIAAVKSWKSALDKAADLLRFDPVVEAPLPEGFPMLTPIGEIRVFNYPTYRLARAAITGRGNNSFWTLFKHIKSRDIAMTAPVEMTYDMDDGKQKTMAFLYRTVQQGRLERDDDVEVIDVPAMTAVSFGLRGNADRETVAAARLRLENWLKAHADQYEAAGPLRVMGHNSPFVAASKRYHEVQIPIRPVHAP